MLELSQNTTVSEIEAANSEMMKILIGTNIFREGQDASQTIGEICLNHGLHPQILINMLAKAKAPEIPDGIDPATLDNMELMELVDHVIDDHHDFLRDRLPKIVELARKVAKERTEQYAELHELLERIAVELEEHLLHEEEALFPMCRDMESVGAIQPTACGDKVAGPIECMKREHNDSKKDFDQIRKLTDDYHMPSDGDEDVFKLMSYLAEIDSNTMEHIYKEDMHLFPRAMDKQIELRKAQEAQNS